MNVEEVLFNLLYKYDCVIVPEFGGFVGKYKSAKFNPIDYTFEPPKKVVGFNSELKETDGLLANELSKLYNISYAESKQEIENLVNNWNKILSESKTVLIPVLGSFQKIDGQIAFTPVKGQNFLYNTYGLNKVQGNYVIKKETQKEVEKRESGNYWMFYVASVALAFVVGAGLFTNNKVVQPQLSSFFPFLNSDNVEVTDSTTGVEIPIVEDMIEVKTKSKKIAEENLDEKNTSLKEGFTLENEGDIPEESFEKLNDLDVKAYQVIGGSFKLYSKAMQHQSMLKSKGYNRAIIIGKVGNFYMVAFDTFNNQEDALAYKRELEKKGIDVFIR